MTISTSQVSKLDQVAPMKSSLPEMLDQAHPQKTVFSKDRFHDAGPTRFE